jgi:hypothetical protein
VRYIARQFEVAGRKPGGTDGWLQRVEFVEVTLDAERITLAGIRQEDAVLTESHRRTEVQGERAAGVAEPLLQDVEADRAKFVLSAQRHVRRDEPTLHGIHDLPYRLKGGPTVRRGEEADLHTNRNEGEVAGG